MENDNQVFENDIERQFFETDYVDEDAETNVWSRPPKPEQDLALLTDEQFTRLKYDPELKAFDRV